MLSQEQYNIKLPIFEGPLDLLLYLIRKNELEIYDISIALILDEYFKYLSFLKKLNLSDIGEFILMASQLIYIKSQTLLPNDKNTEQLENLEDPRKKLVAQLVEYQKYKEAAKKIDTLPQLDRDIFKRILQEDEFNVTNLDKEVLLDLTELAKTFYTLIQKFEANIDLTINQEDYTIEMAINKISDFLKNRNSANFNDLLDKTKPIVYIIIMFLAILELTKRKKIQINQDAISSEININK